MFHITYHKSAYSDLVVVKSVVKIWGCLHLSSNEAHLGYACNTHAIPFDFLYSIAYFFAKIKEPAYYGKLLHLSYLDFSFQSGEGFHFLFLCRFIIYIHRRCNVGVSHNLLNDLEIRFILAEACAKNMAEIVAAKVRKQLRFSSLFLPTVPLANYTP